LPDGRRASWKKVESAVAEAVEFDASKIDPNAKCKTCGIPFKSHFEFDANGNITHTRVRHMQMKDDFPGMPGLDPGAFKPKPGLAPRPTPGTSNLARPNPTPDLPQATMSQNKTTGEALIQYNGKSYQPGGPAPEGATGTRVFVPAAAFGIRSMGNVIALLSNDGIAHAERPLKVYNTMYRQAQKGAAKPGATLDEAGEWKAEAEDFKEWSNHVKEALLSVEPSQRFAMAKKLSQIELKHFGAGQATASGSFNAQTGRPTGSTSGMTTTVEHILDAINAGKITQATTPAATAAIASAGTTQQTPFGSVTRPAGQPDPYQASPALAGGDRPAAVAAQNRPRPQQGSGAIKILRTEQDWEEAMSDSDSDVDLDDPSMTVAQQKAEMMKRLPSWKIMLATILLALKTPIIGNKLRKVMIAKMEENFGITMSPKEVLEYMEHVYKTPAEEILPPAVWKFEKDGGDYETALEQLPDDAVEVRPSEVMSTIATGLIDAGVAQEIKPGEETPSEEDTPAAGAGAFGSMADQLTKKESFIPESAMPASVIKAKEKIRSMSDAEKKEFFKGKTKEQLQKQAWRHGYGQNSNVYSKFVTEDATVGTIPASGTRSTSMTTPTKFAPAGKTTPAKFNAQGQLELDDNAELDDSAVKQLQAAGVKIAEGSNELESILNQYSADYANFKAGGDIDENQDFFDALYEYYFDEMPYGVRKARTGDPYEWITQKLDQEAGVEPVAEGVESMTPNWAKYVLDQIYNSNGDVTLTDLFDEGIPGLHAMFMATAEAHGLDPEEEFEDVQHELTVELEDIIKGGHGLDEAENIDAELEATPGEQASADQNIIMQIRKASDYEKPTTIALADGTEITITQQTAEKILTQFNKLMPQSKELMQSTLNTEDGFNQLLDYFGETAMANEVHMEASARARSIIKSVFGQ
jgi:hypothetical protein